MRHTFFLNVLLFAAISRAADLSLTVLTPDDHPAVGAKAVLVPAGSHVYITDGREFDVDESYIHATADEHGRITFASPPEKFLLVALHEDGSAQLHEDEIAGDRLRLTQWARLSVIRKIGPSPAEGKPITIWATRGDRTPYDPNLPTAVYSSQPTNSAIVNRLPPGEVNIAPADKFIWGQVSRPMRTITLSAGETQIVTMGGTGRPVVGHVDLPESLRGEPVRYAMCMIVRKPFVPGENMPDDVVKKPLAQQAAWWETFNSSPRAAELQVKEDSWRADAHAHTYPFDVDENRAFRIEDVEAGDDYQFVLRVHETRHDGKLGPLVAEAELGFTVPPMPGGRSDEPLVLPPVVARLVDDISVGEEAPDFTITGLDDRPIRLADYRGKFVLLDFWATWCGPCIVEMDTLRDVERELAGDERFVMIGLASDRTPDKPLRFVREHEIHWQQGFLGEDSAVQRSYHVSGIPSIWLIGPDGKVLAKNLRGERTVEAVRAALRSGH